MGKEARTTLDQKNVLIVEKNHLAAPVSVTLLLLPPHTTKSNLPQLLIRTLRILSSAYSWAISSVILCFSLTCRKNKNEWFESHFKAFTTFL